MELKTIKLLMQNVQKKRVAVIEFEWIRDVAIELRCGV